MRPGSQAGPFRSSHFAAAHGDADAVAAWAAAGYNATLISEALAVLEAAWAHPNLAWGLQLPSAAEYR